jgi:hypothetical protein
MAEIEYQVDELLFRMNALTGSHGLPEKPPCYLTDSDCTYGGGDDGISSAGSEVRLYIMFLFRSVLLLLYGDYMSLIFFFCDAYQ